MTAMSPPAVAAGLASIGKTDDTEVVLLRVPELLRAR
jgi:hypothetical protein